MPVFYPEAIKAALKISGRYLELPDEDAFEKWSSTCEMLGKLTYQERCDAVYSDYALQLAAPGGHSQLQIRDFLLGQGALAANYLAELAQNADDAAVDDEAKLCVHFHSPWLIVGNNGKMVDSGNLLGLSRFFIHWGRDDGRAAQKLDGATIGKFGIGFKSCYRVAREVLVYSWNGNKEAFAFRLPIVKKGDDLSKADPNKWQQICAALQQAGKRVNLQPSQLGYCTPEFLSPEDLPEALKQSKALCQWERGTVFCFNLHQQGQAEVAQRIQMGAQGLYELCPLFLPHIREITLNNHRMLFGTTRVSAKDSAGLPLKAQRATLSFNGDHNSNDRFWLLSANDSESKWTLALAADSSGKVRIASQSDGGIHLRSGGAYAFFPLNAVNQTWSNYIRLHLHIDLPTNLARSDWNGSEDAKVRAQIAAAADALVNWLAKRADTLHPDFMVQDLFNQIPPKTAKWANWFYESFRKATDEVNIFRTISGKAVTAQQVGVITLKSFTDVKAAAKRILDAARDQELSHDAMFTWDATDWGLKTLTDAQVTKTFGELAEIAKNKDPLQRDLARVVFALDRAKSALIENCAALVTVSKKNGEAVSLKQLLGGVGGAELTPDWHSLFRSISNTRDPTVLNIHVCNTHLGGRLNELGQAQTVLEWDRIPEEMISEADWNRHGELFWNGKRVPCDSRLADAVIKVVRIRDKQGRWEEICSKWLLDNNPCQCFLGLITAWRFNLSFASESKPYVEKLKQWGLWEAYQKALFERIGRLDDFLIELLRTDGNAALPTLNGDAFKKTLDRLQPQHTALVKDKIKSALKQFLLEKKGERTATKFFLPVDLDRHTQTVLDFLGYAPAGNWLGAEAQKVYQSFEVWPRDLEVVKAPLMEGQKEAFAKEILLKAWLVGNSSSLTGEILLTIQEWFSRANRNWEVGISTRQRVYLRDCSAIGGDSDSLFELLALNGKNLADIPDRLPDALAEIPRLREVAMSAASASIRVTNEDQAQPITAAQIDPDLRGLSYISNALNQVPNLEVFHLQPLNFDLKNQGNRLLTVENAICVLEGSRLFVSRAAVADDYAFDRLLAVYLSFKGNPELDRLQREGNSARQLYYTYRREILSVFRKELVEDVGYKKRDIVRELLQNTESAYASQAGGSPSPKAFRLSVDEIPATTKLKVMVEHTGRPFNAVDKTGKQRDDINRIVSQGNQAEIRVDGEIGRFNRGFKSVFHVTDCVEVRSGAYSFQIRDLILKEPSEPKPDKDFVPQTKFSFECPPADVRAMLGALDREPHLHASSLVFLREIERIELSHGNVRRSWSISRTTNENWTDVRIKTEDGRERRFQVNHFRNGAVAIAVNAQGLPRPLDEKENFLCLTFPGTTPGFGDFLLNGFFDTDQGRISLLLNNKAAHILEEALLQLKRACEAAMEDAETSDFPAVWQAWAHFLSPKKLKPKIEERLGNYAAGPLREVSAVRERLLESIPHLGDRAAQEDLIFPNQTLRKLAEKMQESFPQAGRQFWCEDSIHETVKQVIADNLQEMTVPQWIEETDLDEANKDTTVGALRELLSTEKNPVLRNEIESALHKLQPNPILPPNHFTECHSLNELVDWWNDNADEHDYAIEGAWAEHLAETENAKDLLLAPQTEEGRLVWYRFLSIASLLSAGRRVSEIQRFLAENPLIPDIWSACTRDAFEDACDKVFSNIVEKTPQTTMASGEYAYLWRRVFYDLRKIHHIVFEYDFGTSLLELCQKAHTVREIIDFARGGQVPGGDKWSGVIGQSAGSTLLFVLRELRRTGIYRPKEDHHCYFMCRPVRRAAVRFGLLDEDSLTTYDLNSLLDQAKSIHERIQEHPAAREAFKNLFDIPFLHSAQEEAFS